MSARKRQELKNGAAAFQIHHIGIASLHDACLDVLASQKIHKAIGQLLGFDDNLEMEIAARVGYESAAQEGATQICGSTAILGHQLLGYAEHQTAFRGQHAHIHQSRSKLRLGGNLDQVVRRFMQDASPNRQVGFQPIQLMQQLDDQTCHRRGIGGDLHAVAVLTRHEQRALDAHKRSQNGLIAMTARCRHARKLVFYLCRERHKRNTPVNASRSNNGSCQVGRCGSTKLRTSTTGPLL